MTYRSYAGGGVCVLVVLSGGLCLAQEPSLDVVLERMGAYQLEYESRAVELVAEERYEQWVKRVPRFGGATIDKRKLTSTFFLVRFEDGAAWYGFREVTKVDGKDVTRPARTLADVLSVRSEDTLEEALSISVENTRYNIGSVYRNINIPLQALQLLHPSHRSRFRFTSGGALRSSKKPSMRIDFTEISSPSIITDGFGGDVPAHGSVVVNPETGAIRRTELLVTGPRGTYIKGGFINVDYQLDERLGMLVPVEMEESFELDSEILNGRATYRNFRRFETTARLVPTAR